MNRETQGTTKLPSYNSSYLGFRRESTRSIFKIIITSIMASASLSKIIQAYKLYKSIYLLYIYYIYTYFKKKYGINQPIYSPSIYVIFLPPLLSLRCLHWALGGADILQVSLLATDGAPAGKTMNPWTSAEIGVPPHHPFIAAGWWYTPLKNMSSSMGIFFLGGGEDYPIYEMENKTCLKPPNRMEFSFIPSGK